MLPVGFIIVSHDKPAQLSRLCWRLHSMFDFAPVVCHHDFSQTPLVGNQFPSTVKFVQPHIPTRWAGFSVVRAFLVALGLLFDSANPPEWFVLLSGVCYPTRPARDLLDELSQSRYEAYIDYRPIVTWEDPSARNSDPFAFNRSEYLPLAYDRYLATTFRVRALNRRLRPTVRTFTLRSPAFNSIFHPYSKTFSCFGGDHWFMARHTAAHALLRDTPQRRKLIKHLSHREHADETFYQTMLCNDPNLKICKENRRYAEWLRWTSHPKVLGVEDLKKIIASRAFFARKLDLNTCPDLFRKLDAITESSARLPGEPEKHELSITKQKKTWPARGELSS